VLKCGSQEGDKILPGSEWLIYGAGAGWPGLLLFTFCMLIPFFLTSALFLKAKIFH